MAIKDLPERATHAIWDRDLKRASLPVKLGFHAVRILYVVVRDLRSGQLNLRSMSLVYTTLLSAVPLLAISLSVLKGFGVHNEFAPLIQDFLAPMGQQGEDIANKVLGFVENTRVGILSSVGVILLLYTVLSVMQKIEGALNYIWHITEPRSLSRRFSDYLSVLLIGPVLVVASTGLSGAAMNNEVIEFLSDIEPIGTLLRVLTVLIPFVLAVCAFTFVYVFIPNTKVQLGSAIVGATTAAILWKLAGWFFAVFVVTSGKYEAVYSAFATLIVFMLWLYTSWLILMIGASVAFYHQRPEFLSVERERARLSARVKEKLALLVIAKIASDHYGGRGATPLQDLIEATGAPSDLAGAVVNALAEAGFIVRTAERDERFLPAKPLDATPASALIEAIRADGEDARANPDALARTDAVGRAERSLAEAIHGALANITLKDLALGSPDSSRKP